MLPGAESYARNAIAKHGERAPRVLLLASRDAATKLATEIKPTMRIPSVTERVLLARIGYMTYYAGSQSGDERPKHGGAYNDGNIGHELYNFRPPAVGFTVTLNRTSGQTRTAP